MAINTGCSIYLDVFIENKSQSAKLALHGIFPIINKFLDSKEKDLEKFALIIVASMSQCKV